jgi:hypothetical protein
VGAPMVAPMRPVLIEPWALWAHVHHSAQTGEQSAHIADLGERFHGRLSIVVRVRRTFRRPFWVLTLVVASARPRIIIPHGGHVVCGECLCTSIEGFLLGSWLIEVTY